jgi:CsoR family transcriptional regulator, copper-sensing transcriptional repressor
MLEEGSDCQQVLVQLAAVKAAVDQVGLHLISERLRSCMADGESDCAEAFDDAVATFLRYASLRP